MAGISSALAVLAGIAIYRLGDGPSLPKGRGKLQWGATLAVARIPEFRASGLAYFGHMWELYAFWAFLPVVLAAHFAQAHAALSVPLWAFFVIGAGSIGCAAGGVISLRTGSSRVAFAQLATSGTCCMLSPVFFHAPTPFFLAFMLLWGITVVGDSPQFSALNAQNAPTALVGSALTIANCIGFSITIVSIQLLNGLAGHVNAAFLYLPLAIGPIFGLLALVPLLRPPESYRTS